MMRFFLPLLLLAGSLAAQKKVTHEGVEGLLFSNGKVELIVLPHGGAFASFTLNEDSTHTNTMWDPARMARETGGRQNFGPSKGHFLCVDGFGPVTKAEQAAGLPGHGEANKLPWQIAASTDTSATFQVRLPLVQENLTRKISIAPGEQVVLVESELESELPFDRVILWAEHATIGAPFVKLGKTIVDQSTVDCQTKPYRGERGARTFPSAQNFTWPELPGYGNLRISPTQNGTLNHIGCLMDPRREHEFITAIDTETNLMIGYLFPRQDYAWVQHWMNYPTSGAYSWGLEFGMQPYDMSKAEILALTPMFGAPTFRWLPAKSKLAARFLMFVTKVPAGFNRVDDVRLEASSLIIENKQANHRIALPFTRGLPAR